MKASFVIYTDLGSILTRVKINRNNPNESYIDKYQEHIASSYGQKVECTDDRFSEPPPKKCRDEDAVDKFISEMFEEVKHCKKLGNNTLRKDLSWVKKMKVILEKLLIVMYVINYILRKKLE